MRSRLTSLVLLTLFSACADEALSCPEDTLLENDVCVGPDLGAPDGGLADMGPCGDCGERQCNAAIARCVSCLSDADCGGDRPACNTVGECVPCRSDEHCMEPEAPSCLLNLCGPCGSDSNCAHLASTPHCDRDAGVCRGS